MRVTKIERYLRGIHDVDGLVFTKRCDKCGDDVRKEPMFRKRFSHCGPGGIHSMWHYLCRTCAPTFQDAAKHWDKDHVLAPQPTGRLGR